MIYIPIVNTTKYNLYKLYYVKNYQKSHQESLYIQTNHNYIDIGTNNYNYSPPTKTALNKCKFTIYGYIGTAEKPLRDIATNDKC